MGEPPLPLSDADLIALMISGGHTPLDRYFLLGAAGREIVAFWHAKNAVMACGIEDNRLFAAGIECLRRRGHPTFAGFGEVYAHAARIGWPGWETYQNAER